MDVWGDHQRAGLRDDSQSIADAFGLPAIQSDHGFDLALFCP